MKRKLSSTTKLYSPTVPIGRLKQIAMSFAEICEATIYFKKLISILYFFPFSAWIGSISVNLLFLFSPVTSSLAERYGVRVVTIAGGLVMSVGLFLSSYAPSLVFLYINYGVLLGIGTSLCGTMALIVTADYFDKHLSLATGIVASGSSFGTLAFAPTLQVLVGKFGWQTIFRIMCLGGIAMAITGLVYKRVDGILVHLPSGKNQCFDLSVLRNKSFVVWTLATSVAGFGYFIPHFFLVRATPKPQSNTFLSYTAPSSSTWAHNEPCDLHRTAMWT